jgi:hypothetical protein
MASSAPRRIAGAPFYSPAALPMMRVGETSANQAPATRRNQS